MKIVFISKYVLPHVGGVEKHIDKVSQHLKDLGHSVTFISSAEIKYPQIKILGLLYIWYWFVKNRNIILQHDVVHVHDVFIWYLPLRILYPKIKVYTTFHGWEGKYPIPIINILQKRLAWKLSTGSISVGEYINKWYGVKPDQVIYGAVDKINKNRFKKIPKSIAYVGRLQEDTGLLKCLVWFSRLDYGYKIIFVGDGPLGIECQKYGQVVGFSDPSPYLKKAETCVAGGYLSYLEAKNNGCKIVTFADNPLKVDCWNNIKAAFKSKNLTTWKEISQIYLKLWLHN
jgi:glycosyltransferase involved in cell wall biosynthesis